MSTEKLSDKKIEDLKQEFMSASRNKNPDLFGERCRLWMEDIFTELLASRTKLAAVEELVKALEFYGDEYHYKDGYVTLCCGCCTGFEKADILDEQGKRARLALEKWMES